MGTDMYAFSPVCAERRGLPRVVFVNVCHLVRPMKVGEANSARQTFLNCLSGWQCDLLGEIVCNPMRCDMGDSGVHQAIGKPIECNVAACALQLEILTPANARSARRYTEAV